MTLHEDADRMIFDAMRSPVTPVERCIEDAQRGQPMRVVCGWCGLVMRGGPPQPISHGMCPACEAKMNAQMDALEATS